MRTWWRRWASRDRTGAANSTERDRLPVAPSLGPSLVSVHAAPERRPLGRDTILVTGIAIGLGAVAAVVARLLTALIGLVTNLAYYGRWSTAFVAPTNAHWGGWSVLVPVAGAIVVGVMARYGSRAIRGHGIPEVMEKVLYDDSRIPARVMLLKPLSAAIAIGTGGPFGAEGPIIATGGAFGSFVGQLLRLAGDERKVLLGAGAAAGMTATFGSPVSAVLLAVELLLFEYRARSLIPVTFAVVTAQALRVTEFGEAPMFALPVVAPVTVPALAAYVAVGVAVGLAAGGITRLVYAIDDGFERLPVPWMWWPALGAIVVGVVGLVEPRTLGVGYTNIEAILTGTVAGRALSWLVVLKLVSWAIYLGSGTSGGTLAPLFTIGGGLGALGGAGLAALAPALQVDVHVAGLVGMAAIFAGASHALLASVVFAFETTRQTATLLPLLAGGGAAFLVAQLYHRHSIMTEKLARRGASVRTEYDADVLARLSVRAHAKQPVVTLEAERTVASVRAWLHSGNGAAHHQGFPIVERNGALVGVLTRRDLLAAELDAETPLRAIIRRPPAVVFADQSLRDAADHMVQEGVGRLPVVERAAPTRVVGMLTRSDLLAAHASRLAAMHRPWRPGRREKPRHTSSPRGERMP